MSKDPKIKYNDFPFDDLVERGIERMNQGWDVYLKFTCSGCGQRLTIDVPNKFFTEGTCDKCPALTDIRKTGGNMMIMTRGLRRHA
jgi:hypothetical protein